MRSLLIAALAVLATTAPAQADEAPCPDRPTHLGVVVLDPGHGGSNEGAVGVAGMYERFLNMDLSKRLRARLLACWPDLEVVLTRWHDVDMSLSARAHTANLQGADVFLSIHFNAAENPEAHGIEVFYLSSQEELEPWPPEASLIAPSGVVVDSIVRDLERTRLHGESARLAAVMLEHLIDHSGAADRGVRQAGFTVLRGTLMPAVVLELGFLTHAIEGQRVLDNAYRERLISAIIDALAAWDAGLD